jgi:uncharacterized membrane protein
MSKKAYSDLIIIFIWVSLTIISTNTSYVIIRTILAIPTLLFIPGYLLLTLIFPKNDDVESNVRIILSSGLSIVIILLMGFILNFTLGIRLGSILEILYIYTIISVIIGLFIRNRFSEDSTIFSISFRKILEKMNFGRMKIIDLILNIVIISLILLTTGVIYQTIAMPKVGEKYTEFYILNSSGYANNYPENITINSNTTLLVGVANHEYSNINYTVQVTLDKELLNSENLTLYNSEKWERYMTFSIARTGDMELKFLLYKENDLKVPYREVHLWVNATNTL